MDANNRTTNARLIKLTTDGCIEMISDGISDGNLSQKEIVKPTVTALIKIIVIFFLEHIITRNLLHGT